MSATAPKPAASEGVRPKVPAWLAAEGIKEGEYLIETKPRLRKIQGSPTWDPKTRVFMNLSLHTMGFQQTLAVKQVKGGAIVPLAPKDIANETGLDPKHVRKILRRLIIEGFCRIEGLRKGEIRIYAYAIPLTGVSEDLGVCRDPQIPQGLPSWLYYRLRQHKVKFPPDFQAVNGCLPDLLGVWADCQKQFEGVEQDLQNRVLGVWNAHTYKEERKEEKDIYKEKDPPPPPFVDNTTKAEDEDPPENIKPEPPKTQTQGLEEAKAEYPADHWDDAKASEAYRQHIKSPTQHQVLIEGIRRHKESARWQDADGRWIPLASNFIAKRLYEYHPPPKLKTLSRAGPKRDAIAEMLAAEEAKEKAKAQGGTS